MPQGGGALPPVAGTPTVDIAASAAAAAPGGVMLAPADLSSSALAGSARGVNADGVRAMAASRGASGALPADGTARGTQADTAATLAPQGVPSAAGGIATSDEAVVDGPASDTVPSDLRAPSSFQASSAELDTGLVRVDSSPDASRLAQALRSSLPGSSAAGGAQSVSRAAPAAAAESSSAATPVARFAAEGSTSPAPAAVPAAQTPADATSASLQTVRLDLALAEGTDATGAVAESEAAQTAVAPTTPARADTLLPLAAAVGVPGATSAVLAVPAVAAAQPSGDGSSTPNGTSQDARPHELGDASSGAASVLGAPLAAAAGGTSASAPTLRVSTPVDSAEFAQDLAARVAGLIDGNLSSAKLQVTPPQLGPIDLQISVQGDRAQILMSTHSAVTREALESSAPQLKELLAAQGFGQVSVDISQRSFQERTPLPQPYEAFGQAESAPLVQSGSTPTARSSSALLDAYA